MLCLLFWNTLVSRSELSLRPGTNKESMARMKVFHSAESNSAQETDSHGRCTLLTSLEMGFIRMSTSVFLYRDFGGKG